MNFRRAVSILILFSLLAGAHLVVLSQNISLKYQLTDIKIKLNEITSQNRLLGSQVSNAENLAAVENAAKTRLGMVYPEKINYILNSQEASRKNVIL